MDAAGHHVLGDDYYYGRNDKPKDPKKAVEHWRLGAEMGNAQCMRNLAWAYLHGYGVQANAMQAGHWQVEADRMSK
jgi:TPR repeat protein